MNQKRPLSPHLQIYRWRWTMFFSIMHRVTGVFITAGVVFLCIKLIVFGFGGEEFFEAIHSFAQTLIFQLAKLAFAWALLVHYCLGIRHLFFDVGKFINLRGGRFSGYAAFSIATIIWLASFQLIIGQPLF
ncbi:MAG: succinate dehydrogenase, cytochrome b556 subunit [Alphaproteobacteria bacterium]|nr:succinate dehydrogenase, cytochrome b556 subunit [Alphaproteobacteria bacterium]